MKIKSIVTLNIIFFFMSGCQSLSPRPTNFLPTRDHLAKQIEDIITNCDPNVSIGIKIMDSTSKEVIFSKNAQRHFMPASTEKLITVAAALYYLGPSFRFRTNILSDGFEKEAGTIRNLYLKGSGDPGLMDSDLEAVAEEIKQLGIKKIMGDIYADDTLFDQVPWVRGAMWDDRNNGYSAPVSAINLNYNRIQLKAVPAHKAELTAPVIMRPFTNYVKVLSKINTKNQKSSRLVSVSVESQGNKDSWPQISNEGLNQGDVVSVSGQLPQNAAPFYSLLAVKDPSLMALHYLKEKLMAKGISFKGSLKRAKAPENAYVIATIESRSLSEALIDFTKISNNVANDSLIKAIAAYNGSVPASFTQGLKYVADFLEKEVGIDPKQMVNADGSGASRYNLITPDQLVAILHYSAERFGMAPEFASSLPIAGLDGTLQNRARDFSRGNIRAKTGSMTGTSNLAGYVMSNTGNRYSFAIMINGILGPISKYNRLQDDILARLFQESPEIKSNNTASNSPRPKNESNQ
jgi:D-alanyl-D-alanine carboxypeptidase/D-alanyl-D-alanine-endopeptidase (penicillin-binding protein 4)